MLGESEDGTWSDIVTWAGHRDAMDASNAVMADPAFKPFVQMIDAASMQMSHLAMVWHMN